MMNRFLALFPQSRNKISFLNFSVRSFSSSQFDRIILRGCLFHGHHGIYRGEREMGQKFIVDVEAKVPQFDHEALIAGNLSATLDYGAVYKTIAPVVQSQQFKLLEQLSFHIMAELFDKFSLIEELKITVKKPHVAVVGSVDYLGVEMTRDRAWWKSEQKELLRRIKGAPKDPATINIE